ncbi:MAG TPA: hypothetical protein DEB39_01585, partial [Planctomycetaceae bacterium]|nr:hypothetical protein [Planctomycetaceae bacterium]
AKNLNLVGGASFTGNVAGDRGGAIFSGGAIGNDEVDVRIGGNTLFLGNKAGSNGGAIYMAGGGNNSTGRATLLLDSERGDITFTGNEAAGVSNAIHLEKNTKLKVIGRNNVYFHDRISGGSGNAFVKEGTGSVSFLGNNVLTTGGGAIQLYGGTTRLVDGAVLSAGNSDFFMDKPDTRLVGNGAIIATDGFEFRNGTVSADDLYKFDAGEGKLVATGGVIGTLVLDGGKAVFNQTTFAVDLGRDGLMNPVADLVEVNGAVEFKNTNTFTIGQWANGTFDIITSTSDMLTFDKSKWNEIVEGRRKATIDWKNTGTNLSQAPVYDKTVIQLTVEMTNDFLTWTNGADERGNRQWDSSSKNWLGILIEGTDCFLTDDYARFTGKGQGDVNVVADGVTTGGMLITQGNYIFNGGGISGRKALDPAMARAYDGVLRIEGGRTTFNTDVDFEGEVRIVNQGTHVILGANGKIATDGRFFLDSGTTFEFTAGEYALVADDIVFNGDVILHRPSVASVDNVIVSTGTVLDRIRLDDLFDGKTTGLYAQTTTYDTVDNPHAMGLNYGQIKVGEFADFNRLGWNESEVAAALDDVFADGSAMDEEFIRLRNTMYGSDMTNEGVEYILDQMRGTEMAADALTIALWSPWRTAFNHLSQDQRFLPAAAHDPAYRGQVGTQPVSTKDFWLQGFWRNSDISNDPAGTQSYTLESSGSILGVDKKVTMNTTLGLVMNFTEPRLNSRFGRIRAHDWGMALYAKHFISDSVYVNAYLGFGHQEYDYERYEMAGKYEADYDGNSLYTSVELVRPIFWKRGGTLLPLIAFDYQKSWASDFEETGGLFAKRVTDGELESTQIRFGLNSRWQLREVFSLDTRLQYGRELSNSPYGTVKATFLSAPDAGPMKLHGVDLGVDFLNVGFGGQVYLNACRTIYMFGDYDYDVGNKGVANTFQLGLVYQR